MPYNDHHKIPCGNKTRIAKQRESHIIFALDVVDKCIHMTDKDAPDINKIKEQLKKLRKEICKL